MSRSPGFFLILFLFLTTNGNLGAQISKPKFQVIAFYTGKNDQAHVSFVKEALRWFPKAAAKNDFSFEATTDWNNINDVFLANYQVFLFLDTRPEKH